MKKYIGYFSVFIVSALVGYYALLFSLPYLLIRGLQSSRSLAFQEFFHTQLPDENSRQVVAPNPDFLYSLAPYDLGNGNLLIEGDFPDSTYSSISFFDQNTSCYFVMNDLQCFDKKVKIILESPDRNTSASSGEYIRIHAPSRYGLVLLRFLATRPEKAGALKKYQNSFQMKAGGE